MRPSQHFYHQNMQLMYESTSILNMSYDECCRIAPDLVFKNINQIEVSADQLFKKVGDGVIVELMNKEKWVQLKDIGIIEQITNAKGRQLYPKVALKLHNLDAESEYYVYLMLEDRDNKVRTFSNFNNEWKLIDVTPHKSTCNIQVMEATVESNSGKYLEGREISFTKMTIVNNHRKCQPSGTISKENIMFPVEQRRMYKPVLIITKNEKLTLVEQLTNMKYYKIEFKILEFIATVNAKKTQMKEMKTSLNTKAKGQLNGRNKNRGVHRDFQGYKQETWTVWSKMVDGWFKQIMSGSVDDFSTLVHKPLISKSDVSKENSQNVLHKINDLQSNGFIYHPQSCVNYQQVQSSNGFNNFGGLNMIQQQPNSSTCHHQVNGYQAANTQVMPQAATFPHTAGFNYQDSKFKNDILYQNQTNAPGKILNQKRRRDFKPNTHTYHPYVTSHDGCYYSQLYGTTNLNQHLPQHKFDNVGQLYANAQQYVMPSTNNNVTSFKTQYKIPAAPSQTNQLLHRNNLNYSHQVAPQSSHMMSAKPNYDVTKGGMNNVYNPSLANTVINADNNGNYMNRRNY